MPAALSASILPAAVPFPPETIAPGVPHSPARRSGRPSDERSDRLPAILLDPSGGFLFRGAADFADQNHRVGFWVVIEKLHRVEMRHAIDRVAADANAGRLPVAARGQLPDRLVS